MNDPCIKGMEMLRSVADAVRNPFVKSGFETVLAIPKDISSEEFRRVSVKLDRRGYAG